MARKAGLTNTDVIDAAVRIADREGLATLSLARLADELGIKPPSLYNHVAGVDGLKRELALRAARELVRSVRAGLDDASDSTLAFHTLCHAYRAFARSNPGLYDALAMGRALTSDPEVLGATMELIEQLHTALADLNLADDQILEAARLVRSSLHGFISLELHDGFGFSLDIDASYDCLVRILDSGIRASFDH